MEMEIEIELEMGMELDMNVPVCWPNWIDLNHVMYIGSIECRLDCPPYAPYTIILLASQIGMLPTFASPNNFAGTSSSPARPNSKLQVMRFAAHSHNYFN
jgi:hypothetical protein